MDKSFLILSFLFSTPAAFAATSYQVDNGTFQNITEFATCKKVTNNHASGLAIFVPTNTDPEWTAFYSTPPSGVTIGSCSACIAGSEAFTSNGTFTVPTDCTTLVIKAWGGGGAGGADAKSADGGGAGYGTTNTIAVTPGDTYTVAIGNGGAGGACASPTGGSGGYAGGAGGSTAAGVGSDGGGATTGGAFGDSTGGGGDGGTGEWGGGGGGADSTGVAAGGGGGGATTVVHDNTTTTLIIAGGGGGGGGGPTGAGAGAGAGGTACAGAGGGNNSVRGGGGGAGNCQATSTLSGLAKIPGGDADTDYAAGVGVGGAKNSTCALGTGGNGYVKFLYSP